MKYTVAIAALLLSACAPAQVASTGEAPVAAAEQTETTLVNLFTVRVDGRAEVVSLVRTYT